MTHAHRIRAHRMVGSLCLLTAGAVLAPAAQAQPVFDSVLGAYPVPVQVGAMITGDFDKDSCAEVVVAGGPVLWVYPGNSSGVLGPIRHYEPDLERLDALAAGDVNGDGYLDLVGARRYAGKITVLLNDGQGGFPAGVDYPESGGATDVAAGDLNGDGLADVVAVTIYDHKVAIRLAGSGGALGPETDLDLLGSPHAVLLADLNGDEIEDIVVAGYLPNTIYTFLGVGDGTFTPVAALSTGMDEPTDVATGDFDGDGKTDVVAAAPSLNRILLLPGVGDGNLGAMSEFAAGEAPGALVACDLDGDGDLDVAAADHYGYSLGAAVLIGDGAGGFATRVLYGVGGPGGAIAVEDLNSDARPDLVVMLQSLSFFSVLPGLGGGLFGARVPFDGVDQPRQVAVGGIDADPYPDVAVVPGSAVSGKSALLLGDGHGGLAPALEFPVGSEPGGVAIADFDEDGNGDLAVSDLYLDEVQVLFGDGAGSFPRSARLPTGAGPGPLFTVDVNRDSHPDLVAIERDEFAISVHLGRGDGTFEARKTALVGATPGWADVGDLDGDGIADLAVANSGSPSVSVLLGTGDGSFRPRLDLPLPNASMPTTVAIGDLDADGHQDVVVLPYVFFGDGAGGFGAGVYLSVRGAGAYPAVLRDFDGDRRDDLAVPAAGVGCVLMAHSYGDRTLAEPVGYGSVYASRLVACDMNLDGEPDLVAAGSGGISVLLNRPGGTPTLLSALPAEVAQGRVLLRWFSRDPAAAGASVLRRADREDWDAVGWPTDAGDGVLTFEDRMVAPGTRYGYVLAVGAERLGEVWVQTPGHSGLTLAGLRPNPAHGAGDVVFTLPLPGAARIEVLDAGGRRRAARDLGGLAAGEQSVRLEEIAGLPSGVYWIRLTQEGQTLQRKAVILN